nr:MAG TPA: hypothetical protein [Caudoviricetes sp.]
MSANSDTSVPMHLAIQAYSNSAALYIPGYGYLHEPIPVTPVDAGAVCSAYDQLFRGALICEERELVAALNEEYRVGGLRSLVSLAVDGAEFVEFTAIRSNFGFNDTPLDLGDALAYPVLATAKVRTHN